jgi:hypothetical protein
LASHYLAAWVIGRFEGENAARSALHYVAPVGEKEDYVSRAMRHITPNLERQRVPERSLAPLNDKVFAGSDAAGIR